MKSAHVFWSFLESAITLLFRLRLSFLRTIRQYSLIQRECNHLYHIFLDKNTQTAHVLRMCKSVYAPVTLMISETIATFLFSKCSAIGRSEIILKKKQFLGAMNFLLQRMKDLGLMSLDCT